MSPTLTVIAPGFLIGLLFGSVGLLSGFCLNSSIKDWLQADDGRRIRSFALAAAVAVLATQLAAAADLVDLSRSIYLQPQFSAPLMFAGGLLFGYGMILANGCASRALVLLGRGNLRSLVVVLVIAVVAQMTLKGLVAPARIALLQWSQATPAFNALPAIASHLGLGEGAAHIVAGLVVALPLAVFALADARFRRAPLQVAAGLAVGALVVAGWLITGYFGADDFNPVPVTSLTFVAPLSDTLQYAMLSTGLSMSFGTALVPGVIAGSFITAALTRGFRVESYSSPNHMLRSIAGAALMGCGGALAYGCSVGQGLTGLSTLSIGSFVAVAGIFVGAIVGLRGRLRVPALQPT
ncbi:YeeE/YedE family protein [Bradyrhizobium sp. U87765 SZCCT0131]|uniref:YeeE/YedE family protein n=1 Tax=unclassified Bradyrhizobium TaxID=2631580 RepID=UPI001BAB75D7|nr:YeeE/YedE family protein [Bradyrhizobium sp. U87765 SZCCT0131]MBR1261402.1 YeeE/YedE family protein [Bradyrhizobium sp. U87765 SZCCT0134]MBR1303150.1 YeeE/YedE family protein [Bradyrhizobium sp. U87765 SZCCT0110]MBR1318756.1 YeeE/YedE family protein [Bradyrhizobium sp. U87765 SZCCT0109]MBR1347081.1 YeeE/YedE family protein [Bradyrhizobium sp. U87765 SZCCT0048]